jgi:dipeptidyl-peptidase-4
MKSRLLIFWLFTTLTAISQQRVLTLEDAVTGFNTYLRPQTLNSPEWKNDSEFSFIERDTLWAEQAQTGQREPVICLQNLNEIINAQCKIRSDNFPDYTWIDNSHLQLKCDGGYYIADLPERKVNLRILLPVNAENPEFSINGRFVAYTIEDDLYLSFADGDVKQVTNDGGNGIVNGKSVHRNEFGISKGIFCSPGGNYIAFYRKDESMVSSYPLVDYMERVAVHTPVRYPMAGMESEQVRVGIYNIATGKTLFLNTEGAPDQYFTNISWSPDELLVYIAVLNRDQNFMQMNSYSVITGNKDKTVFTERHDKYVEPLYPVQFSKADENIFYYLSRRDGWFHLYKYNSGGRLLGQVTGGEWEVTKLSGFDQKDRFLFLEATKESYLERHLYRVDLRSGKMIKLSEEIGIHSGKLSPGGKYLLDTWQSAEIPSKTEIISADGTFRRTVHSSDDPLNDYYLGENKLVTLTAADGITEITGRLILPPDFDPSQKYPVIIYVYGGPHLQLITKGWHNNVRGWQYYMASKGYICFSLDNRGSANRGMSFENVIHRRLGVAETDDQMKGVEYLCSLPYVDNRRIGVHGWSFGGFMTLNMMLRHPGVFRVGVSGGPVVDWSMYEVMYGERYMDTPVDNPEGYDETSMVRYVPELNGKLLLIHGMQDDVVVMQHTVKFLRECVKQGKQVDFFPYPTHPHNILGKDRIHLMERVSNYFFDNL